MFVDFIPHGGREESRNPYMHGCNATRHINIPLYCHPSVFPIRFYNFRFQINIFFILPFFFSLRPATVSKILLPLLKQLFSPIHINNNQKCLVFFSFSYRFNSWFWIFLTVYSFIQTPVKSSLSSPGRSVGIATHLPYIHTYYYTCTHSKTLWLSTHCKR